MKNYNNFFKKLKKLKLYIIELKKNDIIKPKIYFAISKNK